ncbi:uncharacterized protein MCYG_02904 [Microsporum canis CBS 113480]|uniref:Uncharacterized protein n=1 Tax=Arthroderma otae (strain ATCC MYA-4605 / CBS 113480) TaxID=554155 RepID=C5FK63_ARTOC|nr:uncharacterized protein MCYG_02904 [Microsporum canis CBS 113480]EEQ30085.1 predicted protein [Microsporum canis CBS 113480]
MALRYPLKQLAIQSVELPIYLHPLEPRSQRLVFVSSPDVSCWRNHESNKNIRKNRFSSLKGRRYLLHTIGGCRGTRPVNELLPLEAVRSQRMGWKKVLPSIPLLAAKVPCRSPSMPCIFDSYPEGQPFKEKW